MRSDEMSARPRQRIWMIVITIVICQACPYAAAAQTDTVTSGVYTWKTPAREVKKNMLTAVMLQGKTRTMAFLQVSANTMLPSREKTSLNVPPNEELLLVVRTGTLSLELKDSVYTVGPRSVFLLMPGEKYAVQNFNKQACQFFTLRYRSKAPANRTRGRNAGGSLPIDGSTVVYKPHDKGGVRPYFERPTVMGKRMEMHLSTLNRGLRSHDPHVHVAEEMILVMEQETEMQIGSQFQRAGAGDLYYLGSNVLHAIRNVSASPALYFAFQFE